MAKRTLTDGQIFLLAWAEKQRSGVLYTGHDVPLAIETSRGRIDRPDGVAMPALVGMERRGYFVRRKSFFDLTESGRSALLGAADRIDALVEAARERQRLLNEEQDRDRASG